MEKDKKLEKTNKLSQKSKIIITSILITELLFIFRGPRLYGVLLFMLTIAVILIFIDKEDGKNSEDEEIKVISESINNEIELIKKSTKKLKYNLASINKLDEITKHLDTVNEKYFFIKKNYGGNRGMDTLIKLINELKSLDDNLKRINDKLLTLYISESDDKNLNDDLDHIINQLDAQKML